MIYDPEHRRIWAGTNGRSNAVEFPPAHHEHLNRTGLELEVWHNHPDAGARRGSYGPSRDDLSMLIARGTRTVDVVNERGRWSATTIASRAGLSWRGWRYWMRDVEEAIETAALRTMNERGTVDWNPDEALMRCAEATGIVTVKASHEQSACPRDHRYPKRPGSHHERQPVRTIAAVARHRGAGGEADGAPTHSEHRER